jgi:bifunctional pyridoxal-dependent enzyme with beta-cystathionase and maltose regulon repressor activities
MAGTIKSLNWGRTMSAWESMTAWRNKRKAFQQKYEANMENAVSALQTAWNDVGYNAGEIAAKRAVKRISDETKAKQEALAKQLADDNNQPYQPTYSAFADGSETFDGGTAINLNNNTLTLSDGTTIDLKTGLKKIDVTV